MRVAVLGGGVAGLVAAREAAVAGHDVVLLEAADRCGGAVASAQVSGLSVDVGAESFAVRTTAVADLLTELGLADDVVDPAAGGAWLQPAVAAPAVPLPRTAVLGIPARPWARDVLRALGPAAAARAALDRVLPAGVGTSDPTATLGDVVTARMGRGVVDRLVAPVVRGVHSAHPDTVGVDVVPGLLAVIRRTGSLGAAVGALRAAAPAGSAVAGLRGGLHRMVTALLHDLAGRGAQVRTGVTVAGLERQPGAGGWTVHVDDGGAVGGGGTAGEGAAGGGAPGEGAAGRAVDALVVDAVVVALPAPEAVRVLGPVLTAVGAEVPLAPAAQHRVDVVTLVVDAPALDDAPRGTGVLVAPGGPVAAKALTHATAKWGWLADAAGPGRHVLRLSYGTADDVAPLPAGPAGTAVALRDASVLLGVPLTEDAVVGQHRTTWSTGLPRTVPGHRDAVGRLRCALDAAGPIAVCGAWVAGAGLASVVPDARAATTALLGRGSARQDSAGQGGAGQGRAGQGSGGGKVDEECSRGRHPMH